MHFLKLLSTFLKINIQMSLAYRADTWVNILINLMWLGWELLGLSIIFNNTDTLGGWGPGELIALLGVFRLVNMLMAALIWPNTEKFNQSVRDGSLDYSLLQPVNTMFLVTISGAIVIYSLWIVLIAFTFWFTKFDNNVTILQALLDAGRYPVTVYPVWLRIIVTFVIPIAVATTVPLQGLRGDLSLSRVLMFVLIGIMSFVVASQVWKR